MTTDGVPFLFHFTNNIICYTIKEELEIGGIHGKRDKPQKKIQRNGL